MEVNKVEELIERYQEGNTSLLEEKQLKTYFSSEEVPSHLKQYKDVFVYYSEFKNEATKEISLPKKKKNNKKWIGIAASVVLATILTTYLYKKSTQNEELDTFDNPEEAFVETRKALEMVVYNMNSGMKNAIYLEEYEKTKQIIFK